MKTLRAWLAFLAVVTFLAPAVSMAAPKHFSRMKELKTLQKVARKRLKLQEKAWKRSFHGRHIPRAERVAAERQYKGYMRSLRAQQKVEEQQLKDQLSLQKAASRAPSSL
jgi:hypothetical protein